MRYRVQFQYRPKGSKRPLDYGQSFDLTGGTRDGKPGDEFLLLPNIGDHVFLPDDGETKGDHGVVENRMFSYNTFSAGGEVHCLINIVITDSDVDTGRLIKE